MLPYLSGILGAVTIYDLFKKWMEKWTKKGCNRSRGASHLMVLSFVGILLPITGIALMVGKKIASALENSGPIDTIRSDLEVWEEGCDTTFLHG